MTSLPQSDRSVVGSTPDGAAGSRRLVAVAVSAEDVLHPESDLRLVAGAASETDVLVARVDRPGSVRWTLPLEAPDYDGPSAEDAGLLDGLTVPLDPVPAVPAGPELPASLHLHRLDLRWRLQDADEPALVAALSELIGFDPDDKVFCVAPAAGASDPEELAVGRAVRRVARVYGLPVLHYRRVPGSADGVIGSVVPEPAA